MTIAENIVKDSKDINEMMNKSMELKIDEDQDWKNEKSTFEFEDGSKLVFNNDDVKIIK